MTSNKKYNMLVNKIGISKNDYIYPKTFGLNHQEFKSIIDEIEYDNLFEKSVWMLDESYLFKGLTFKGKNFIENSDKKEYNKIEKTEVYYNNNVSVNGNNNGNIITGNNNNVNSEFNQKFNDLLNAVNQSNIQDKNIILKELNNNKNNEFSLKQYMGTLLNRGAEVASITSAVGAVFGTL